MSFLLYFTYEVLGLRKADTKISKEYTGVLAMAKVSCHFS
jgi:hypothetical protein